VSVYTPAFAGTHCTNLQMDGQAELTWVAGYTPTWFTCYRQSPIQKLTGSSVE